MTHLVKAEVAFSPSFQGNDRGIQVVALRHLPRDWRPKTGRKAALRVNEPIYPCVMLDLSSGADHWHAVDTKRDDEP